MWHGDDGIRVNAKGRRHAFKKCTLFFFVPFFLLFSVKNVSAQEVSIPAQGRQTIGVTAVVPETATFAYVIRKNSSVTLNERAVNQGQSVTVTVRVLDVKDEALSGHTVELHIGNTSKEVTRMMGKSDGDGTVTFVIGTNGALVGEDVVRVADVTYGEPIWLENEAQFSVVVPVRVPEKSSKETGVANVSGGSQHTAGRAHASAESMTYGMGIHSGSDTMEMPVGDFSLGARAGPDG